MSNIQSKLVNLGGNITGTLPIANGGTANVTASAAFNALSPITTTGDMIYSASGATNSRLAVGTSSQVLAGGTVPTYTQINSTNFFTSGAAAAASTYGIVKGGNVPGDTSGSGISAGFIGETVTASLTNTTLSNGTPINFTGTLTLNKGAYLVFLKAYYTFSVGATQANSSISTTSGTHNTPSLIRQTTAVGPDVYNGTCVRFLTISSDSTSVYAVVDASFASGSGTAGAAHSQFFAVRVG